MNFIDEASLKILPGVDIDILKCKLKDITTTDDAIQRVVSLSILHPDYQTLAAKLELKRLYERSLPDFCDTMMYFKDQLSPTFLGHVKHLQSRFDLEYIRCERDNLFTYAALKTLQSVFLLTDGKVFERPQFMFMRTAIQLHARNIPKIIETYDLLSRHYYIHGSPTLINSGKRTPQLASCFLIDSPTIDTFFSYMKRCQNIFDNIGGVGIAFHKIPTEYFVPCVRILNDSLKLNSNLRNPSCCVYLEVWHGSIYQFLELKTNIGDPETKARDLFYALWVCDLFMQRVEQDKHWSLFCPSRCKGLEEVHGEEFEKLYLEYERDGRYVKRVRARDLFKCIIRAQIETGGPYFLYKDTCNRQSPYKGTIQCSNLCAEIVEYSATNETAVCNLASLALPRFVKDGRFDFEKLSRVTRTVVRNLDRTICTETLPVDQSANNTYRPLGIGIQGLADVFHLLRLPFESSEARELNRQIAETIYDSADRESWAMSSSSSDYRKHVLLCAYMPTATTSLLLDNTECFEPVTSNLYVCRLKWGNFYAINKHLVADLIRSNMWTDEVRTELIRSYGSVQNLEGFPYKELYKTVWEIPQKYLVDLAADRQEFVDQSQSLNIFLADPTVAKLSALHFYTWKKQLKTGLYYLRSKPGYNPIQFSLSCCSA